MQLTACLQRKRREKIIRDVKHLTWIESLNSVSPKQTDIILWGDKCKDVDFVLRKASRTEEASNEVVF